MRYPLLKGGAWKSLPVPSCYPATEPPLFSNKYKAFPSTAAVAAEKKFERIIRFAALVLNYTLSRNVHVCGGL